MKKADLRAVETHFAFGENWSSFAEQLDEAAIRSAEEGIFKLIPAGELRGKSFLDIGCGSGLHALAAARLGAGPVLATDIDAVSVETTAGLFASHAPKEAQWSTKQSSIFELVAEEPFDIVYSWGVLHHTGDMYAAIARAAGLVKLRGLFVFALYRRTSYLMDRLWTLEKRWYATASPAAQQFARSVYIAALRAGYRVRGRSFAAKAAGYKRQRGAEIHHDIHDWLGGYPYEVISPAEVARKMCELGFEEVRSFTRGRTLGLFGSGCDEYVYRRER